MYGHTHIDYIQKYFLFEFEIQTLIANMWTVGQHLLF